MQVLIHLILIRSVRDSRYDYDPHFPDGVVNSYIVFHCGIYQNLFNHSPVSPYYKQCYKKHPCTSLHTYENIFIEQIPAIELGSKSPNIFGAVDSGSGPPKI